MVLNIGAELLNEEKIPNHCLAAACPPAVFPCFSPLPHTESGWEVQPPSLGSTVWSYTANKFFLRSWTTCKGWFCILNLGRVFFIIPTRRGIFIIIGKLSSLLMGGQRGIGCPCGNRKHHWQPVTNEYAQHLQLTCFACLGPHASKLAVWKFQWPTAVIPGVLLQVFFSELFFILEWSYLPPLILCFPGSLAPGLNKSLFHQCKAGPWAPLHHALLLLHSPGRTLLFRFGRKLKALSSIVDMPAVSLRSTKGYSEGSTPYIWHLQVIRNAFRQNNC